MGIKTLQVALANATKNLIPIETASVEKQEFLALIGQDKKIITAAEFSAGCYTVFSENGTPVLFSEDITVVFDRMMSTLKSWLLARM